MAFCITNTACKITLYARRAESGIKYAEQWRAPQYIDNPKLAVKRYFLNAIDKVTGLREKYEKEQTELDTERSRPINGTQPKDL